MTMSEKLPEREDLELRYASLAPDVWEALGKLPRTGWVRMKVKDPETVQEHTIALRSLALAIIGSLKEFSAEDREDIVDMLEVHDWAEAIVGDQVVVTYDEEEKKRLLEAKFKLEYEAISKICEDLIPEDGDAISNLWLRFEKGADAAASFARQADRYQAIEKAFEYEQRGEKVSTKEFIDYAEKGITHPALVERLARLKKKLGL